MVGYALLVSLTLLLRLTSNLVNVIPSVAEESHYQTFAETSFQGVSFFFATLPARKRGLFLAEAVIMLIAAKKRSYFMASAINFSTELPFCQND